MAQANAIVFDQPWLNLSLSRPRPGLTYYVELEPGPSISTSVLTVLNIRIER